MNISSKKTALDIRKEQLKTKSIVVKTISRLIKDVQDREDVEQDVYEKMLVKEKDYVEQGRLCQFASIISRNASIDFLRKKPKIFCPYDNVSVDKEIYDNNDLKRKRMLDCLDKLLDKVKEVTPMPVDLRIFYDFVDLNLSKTEIRLKEHVSMRRINKVIMQTQEYVLKEIESEDDFMF